MILKTSELVSLLRSSVNVQIPGSEDIDKAYLTMSDEDILLFIKLGVSRAYPDVETLEELPDGSEYAVVLLAKIELYLKLAVIKADKIDMGADGAYLKQSQRFDHYMKLAEKATGEYNDWLDKESSTGNNTVNTYDVLLSNRHYTKRNYEKQPTPKVKVFVTSLNENEVDFKWKMSNSSHFGKYEVYIDVSPIVNIYEGGYNIQKSISDSAKCILSTYNIRNCMHHLSGLEPDTTYYITVFSIERNGVFGYAETSFTTPESISVDGI